MTRATPSTGRTPAGRRKGWGDWSGCSGGIEDSGRAGEPAFDSAVCTAAAAVSPATSTDKKLAAEQEAFRGLYQGQALSVYIFFSPLATSYDQCGEPMVMVFIFHFLFLSPLLPLSFDFYDSPLLPPS